MFVRGLPMIYRSPEDDGSGGTVDPPAPAPIPRPQAAATPAPTPTPARSDTIADVRAEAAQYRISAREHKEAAERANEQLAALKLQHETDKVNVTKPLQSKLEKMQLRVIESTLTSKLVAAGLVDVDLVALSRSMPDAPTLTLNDDGDVVGADDMVAKFKAWKPDYFKAAGADPAPAPKKVVVTGAGGEPKPAGGAPKTNVRDMTKEEYRAFKAAELGKVKSAGWGVPAR